jgi:EAL domain-containing protein (putative c-di-GMP-specific phosphodiesterase class I)
VDEYISREELNRLAESLISIFENPFDGGTEHQYVNAEVAIVEIQHDNVTVDKVLQDASLALNQIFKQGNHSIRFYSEDMEHRVQRSEQIERALRAIIRGEVPEALYLEFQPKLDLKTNRINGFEALARLKLPDLGNVSPLEFIAIAEEKLLIYELGNEILDRACQFVAQLRESGFQNIGIAVNVSGVQLLRDEFTGAIQERILKKENDGISLEFEITESVLLDNFDLINDKLNEIRGMGILVSLDDFGTGFSSFSRLRELNIDAVKIDKYFVDKILRMKEDDLITADIISMSHKIGRKRQIMTSSKCLMQPLHWSKNSEVMDMTTEERQVYWEKQVKRWQASGMSMHAWGKKQGISDKTLGNWRRKLQQQKEVQNQVPSGWQEVKRTTYDRSAAMGIKLEVNEKIKIELKQGFDPQLLMDVVRVLTQC